ncbi:hypothetical protein KPH14_007661 [Odynerus spinipes]|uniref:Uncharacterized protein n=1 Tax=Odynerus spinipes TaxID=1348599 RepID=A0AAD9R8Y5_9HYME|nr:hypothetical protein KPH14_007661 [Odynerus spinipes]
MGLLTPTTGSIKDRPSVEGPAVKQYGSASLALRNDAVRKTSTSHNTGGCFYNGHETSNVHRFKRPDGRADDKNPDSEDRRSPEGVASRRAIIRPSAFFCLSAPIKRRGTLSVRDDSPLESSPFRSTAALI